MIDAVEAVSSSTWVRVVRMYAVRIRVCALHNREAMAIDRTHPRDWSKWVRGSLDV